MDALTSPQLSTEIGRIGQAQCYREPEYDGRDHVCVLPVMYAVYIYQTLPRGGTIPNAPWIRVRRRLPNITGSFARDANLLGVFGMVYQRLPTCRSGSDPATGGHYQAPPPGNKDGYYTLRELYVW